MTSAAARRVGVHHCGRGRTRHRASHREQIAGIQGATVVLPPDSAASAGARGVYDNIEHNTMLRDAGYVELGVDPADPGAEVDVPPEGGNGGNGGRPGRRQHRPCQRSRRAAATLTCTMGEWTGEPTSYVYAWQVNGVGVGTDGDLRRAGSRRWPDRDLHVTATNAQARPQRLRQSASWWPDDDIGRHDCAEGTASPWRAHGAAR